MITDDQLILSQVRQNARLEIQLSMTENELAQVTAQRDSALRHIESLATEEAADETAPDA